MAAGLVARPEDWSWSSCRAHLGWVASPDWLETATLLAQMLERPAEIEIDADRQAAATRYADLVGAVRADDTLFWTGAVRGQVFKGDDDFVARMQSLTEPARLVTKALPKAQRGPARSWSQHLGVCGGDRNAALCAAFRGGAFTMPQLATHAGLSVSQVSRLIAAEVNLATRETRPRAAAAGRVVKAIHRPMAYTPAMEFEWDEAKSEVCFRERGFDFAYVARAFFDSHRRLQPDTRREYGEDRFQLIGRVDGRLFVLVYTLRGQAFRIISARKANQREVQGYDSQANQD